jgi:hypothetical protein
LKSLKEGAGEYSRLGKEWLGKELKSEKGVIVFLIDHLRRIGPSPNKVLPSSLADWHQKEENLKLGECDLQGGDGDTSRPAAAPNVG